MLTIKQVLAAKGAEVSTIDADADAVDAIKFMVKHNIGSLLVVDNNANVAGIISEKDFSCNVVARGRMQERVSVKEVMTTPVAAIRPGNTVEEGMAIMTDKRVRHLPVMEDGKLIGLVSIGDLVKAIITDQEFTIKQLEQYIYC